MGEWDELEARLKELGAAASRLVDEPLDPERVRRLGDRRRVRRVVAAILIAVAIFVSGGVGVYAVTSQPELQPQPPSPVGHPTTAPTSTPEPSEGVGGRGEKIPPTSGPGRGRQSVPPTYTSSSPVSPDPTPESPTPSEPSSPSPSETSEEPQSPEPTSTWTEDPDAQPTSEPTSGGGGGGAPTQTAPAASEETAGG
jgi:hypothetical protein